MNISCVIFNSYVLPVNKYKALKTIIKYYSYLSGVFEKRR